MTKVELIEIRKKQAQILDNILGNPSEIERIARNEYGDSWQVIFAGENHPLNKNQNRSRNNKNGKD